ncbi:MAG: cellulase family glycosylhydrolase [Actinobacteria bacterium]|nr:cellulase family glycosylhydrolase [Actinomycetota bacterium]
MDLSETARPRRVGRRRGLARHLTAVPVAAGVAVALVASGVALVAVTRARGADGPTAGPGTTSASGVAAPGPAATDPTTGDPTAIVPTAAAPPSGTAAANGKPTRGGAVRKAGTDAPTTKRAAARPGAASTASAAGTTPKGTPVARWGRLMVCGARLGPADGTVVQLRGVSSMWLNWDDDHYAESLAQLRFMRDSWGITVVRAAMGVEPGGAYLSDPATARKQVERIVENATKTGVYVIVDYHAHEATSNRAAAQSFFAAMAKKYGSRPNVLWETFNEPLAVSWKDTLKPYHQAVLASIRTHDPDNVVILGTPTWSQDVDQAAASPVKGKNLMYTLHFYSCTHGADLRAKADRARAAGLPLFITEWGASNADGGLDGAVCESAATAWLNWAKKYRISWTAWKLDDCTDSTCLLTPGTTTAQNWNTRLHGHATFVVRRIASG